MKDNKIRVLHTTTFLNTGGTEALLKEYIMRVSKNRFVSAVMCSGKRHHTVVEDYFAEKGIRTFFVGDHLKRRGIPGFSVYNALKCYLLSYRYISSVKPDIIHAHLWTTRFIIPYVITHPRVKLFHTVHCPPWQMFEDGKTSKKENVAVKFLTKRCGMRLIALHPEMAKELNSRFGLDDTAVLNNGIDIGKFRNPGVSKAQMRRELGLPEDAFVLGHVGRFAPEKNHSFILKVFAELLKKKPDAYLLLVGSGICEDEVMEMIRSSGVDDRILPISNRGDIERVLTAMDAFIFPSLFEGLGIALLEAQAAGLRCVVSENVPSETHASDRLTALSLDAPLSEWVDAILDPEPHSVPEVDLSIYDIRESIASLEKMYLHAVGASEE
ncbi:MAG: glycosyltransferase [Clostridia bacterium]|nr:glycosyltransferase [Clostridia bacterium]